MATATKKRTRKCKTATNPVVVEDQTPRANWGANETPRHCRRCKATDSDIVQTRRMSNPVRAVRYRVCKACGQRYSTVDAQKCTTV